MVAPNYKFLIIEENGNELAYPKELSNDAQNIAFAASGVLAENVRDAILEVSSKIRDPRQFKMNGTVSNGDWITIDELVSSFKYVFTENVKFYGLEWSNGNGNNRSFDLEFYKNGIASGDKFYTYEIRDSTNDYASITGLNYTFQAGDWMRVKYIDRGSNVGDFAGRFLFEVL